ncbi:MAG: hypothetical protein K2Q24_09910 [Chitinophagaceae bacterium]|jgi:hypothetical protein|nr:hypothetical protein [Chitinophagaceae bacterium]
MNPISTNYFNRFSMKNGLLLFLLLAISLTTSAQVVTGVYKGKMEVDSPKYTVDFELTLKEKDGKLYGYCHRLFIVNDVLFYNLVKVNARIADSMLIVEDEKSVSNNFEEKTKGVKTVMFFKIQKENDTVSVMPGEWSTSRTKKFLPITGKIAVTREQNYLATQLYKRLEDKKLDKEMAFEQPAKPQPAVVSTKPKQDPVVQPTTVTPAADTIQSIAGKVGADTKPTNNHPVVTNQPKQNLPTAPVAPKPTEDTTQAIAKTGTDTKPINNNPVVTNQPKQNQPTNPVANKPAINKATDTTQTVANNKPVPVTTQPKQTPPTASTQKPTSPVQQQPTINTVKTETKPSTQKPTVTTGNPTQTSTVVTPEKPAVDLNKVGQETTGSTTGKPAVQPAAPPVINNPVITKRAMEIIQAVEVMEDSIVLSLYDNGEIDGDTVSVFVNNELVVAKVGLSAKAFKYTLYFKPGETIQLTLFAENLGSIPPNTGLLVIYTATERFQINFSSNLNKSSSILLRRKQ